MNSAFIFEYHKLISGDIRYATKTFNKQPELWPRPQTFLQHDKVVGRQCRCLTKTFKTCCKLIKPKQCCLLPQWRRRDGLQKHPHNSYDFHVDMAVMFVDSYCVPLKWNIFYMFSAYNQAVMKAEQFAKKFHFHLN